jgi:hypothetical protein
MRGFRTISIDVSPVVTLLMIEWVIPNHASRLRLVRRNQEKLNAAGKLADLRLTFLVSEEAAVKKVRSKKY